MRKHILTLFVVGVVALSASAASAKNPSDRITVDVHGNGAEVVLIPGLTCSGAVWDATARRLEGRYRVHVVSIAGFGGLPAGANAQGPVIGPTVDALDAYIQANKLKSPRIIGHSLGGLIGLMIAAEHPQDVGRLMIVDSLPFYGVLMGAKDATAATPQAAAMRDNIIGETQEAYAQGEREYLRSLVKSPDGYKAALGWAVASNKSIVARAMYEDITTDMRPKLGEIKTPVTVLYPWDSSTGMPKAAVDGLYQESFAPLADKRLVRIEGAYHFIMLDQSGAFGAEVEKFLKE